MRKGATTDFLTVDFFFIVALRNEKGSYNLSSCLPILMGIVALRNEKGSYNCFKWDVSIAVIVALRNEKGSYND